MPKSRIRLCSARRCSVTGILQHSTGEKKPVGLWHVSPRRHPGRLGGKGAKRRTHGRQIPVTNFRFDGWHMVPLRASRRLGLDGRRMGW